MKEFHIGKEKINTVKVMTTELAYMKGVAIKHQSDLAKNGFSADDIATFDTFSLNLATADTEQENAKKAQASATAVRDKSWDSLQKLVKKVRNIAKVKFRKDDDILNEFSSITVRRTTIKRRNTCNTANNGTEKITSETSMNHPAIKGRMVHLYNFSFYEKHFSYNMEIV
jgi:hypothetical protein